MKPLPQNDGHKKAVSSPEAQRQADKASNVIPLDFSGQNKPKIPDYLEQTYHWAYVNPATVSWLDNDAVVWSILWGNAQKLMRSAFDEITPGSKVLQPAYVYGTFTPKLAAHIGADGHLDVIDILPLQVENCKRRLKGLPHARVRLSDAATPGHENYDAVCCYFLLHELPCQKKKDVVNALLRRVPKGGKVIFTDYHKPARFHPLRPLMYLVWKMLEPFAIELLETNIEAITDEDLRSQFEWRKQTFFGGLYQKVVATRI